MSLSSYFLFSHPPLSPHPPSLWHPRHYSCRPARLKQQISYVLHIIVSTPPFSLTPRLSHHHTPSSLAITHPLLSPSHTLFSPHHTPSSLTITHPLLSPSHTLFSHHRHTIFYCHHTRSSLPITHPLLSQSHTLFSPNHTPSSLPITHSLLWNSSVPCAVALVRHTWLFLSTEMYSPYFLFSRFSCSVTLTLAVFWHTHALFCHPRLSLPLCHIHIYLFC
jgi:hypothetical protein